MRDYSDQVTWVVVADGEKAVFLLNHDLDARPDLRVLDAAIINNPPSREQGVARPGRMNDGRAGGARRSSFEETDFHRLAKAQFAREIVERLNRSALNGVFDRLVLFAPAATLGEMRTHYNAELKKRIVAEADKDLTRHPIADVERHAADALAGRQ